MHVLYVLLVSVYHCYRSLFTLAKCKGVSLAFDFERTELGHICRFIIFLFLTGLTYCVDPVNEKNEFIRPHRNHRLLVPSFLNKEIRDES